MKVDYIRKLLILVMTVAILASVVLVASAAGTPAVVVKAGETEMTISVSGVGSSGTAQVYRVAANEYFAGDALTGKGTGVANVGTVVGEYACGGAQEIKFARFEADGSDNLFDKYYVVQDGAILAGPVYATDIASAWSNAPFNTGTKKGLTVEDYSTIETAKEMKVGNTVINMNLSELIVATEDANGNPRDLSGRTDLIEFESNGKTYYFDADYVNGQDHMIRPYSQAGINISLVIISWNKTVTEDYPTSLRYFVGEDRQTMAFNTLDTRGMEYWVAAMEFIAERYTKSAETGLIDKFIIGNEIDFAYDWYLIEPQGKNEDGSYKCVDMDVFMEEYARTLRLAELAVKKYNSESKVCVSLSHNWKLNVGQAYGKKAGHIMYNSYAPKDMFDWLVKNEGARGNYDWSLAVHPYPVGTTPSNPIMSDPAGTYGKKITGDPDNTPWITLANLELYQLYLQRPENTFNGEIRTVSLTETCICSVADTEPDYELTTHQQAANIAQTYYRAVHVPCIDQVAYFQEHDQTTTPYKLGLKTAEGVKKPAYDVWKYIDTGWSFPYAEQYLGDIGWYTTYKGLMPAVASDFDWEAAWDPAKIITGECEVTFKNYDGSVISKTVCKYGDTITVPTEIPTRPNDEDGTVYTFVGWSEEVSTVCTGSVDYIARYSMDGVRRVYGSTRYKTALSAAETLKKLLNVDKFQSVIVASGEDFADALSGSYLANQKSAPILLVREREKDMNRVKDYIRENLVSGGTVYILGGEKAVSKNMETGLDGFKVKRLAGPTRYETNLAVLLEAGIRDKEILVCTGKDFADSLSASAVNKPILLVREKLKDEQKDCLATCKENKLYIVGGVMAVNERVERNLNEYAKEPCTRIDGKTRYYTTISFAKMFFPEAKNIVLAYGKTFPDALTGGTLAAATKAPLILSSSSKMDKAIDYMTEKGLYEGMSLGGTAVFKDKTIREIFRMAADQLIKEHLY